MTGGIYRRALGDAFDDLHPRLRERYGIAAADGRACVGRGRMERIFNGGAHLRPALGLASRRALGFPETGRDVPFEIRNYAYRGPDGRETVSWLRRFAIGPGRRFDAAMVYDDERDAIVDYLGRGGPLVVDLAFSVRDDGGLRIESGAQRLAVGDRTVPLPQALAGRAVVEEWYDDRCDRFRVSVTVENDLVGRVFGYRGTFDIEWIDVEAVPPSRRPRTGTRSDDSGEVPP